MRITHIFPKIFCIGLLALVACDDGLDTIPPGEVSETIFWQRERDAVLAVNAAYAELNDPSLVKELDGVTDIGYRASSGPGTFHDVGAGNIDPTNSAINSHWDRYYRGVRRANDVVVNIDRIQEGDPGLLNRVKAEARFLRAYYYTQLTSLWGDVPLILEPLEINDHRPRNPKEEVVDFIIAELDAINNEKALPQSQPTE